MDESYVTYSSLPADSNADGTSAPGDIISLINCCVNEVCTPPYGDYSCDINHDGSWNSSDISRLIDLLNGAQTFIPWLNEPLPTNTCPDAGESLAQRDSGPSVSELNAEFIDGFVTYLSTAVIGDSEGESLFSATVKALTEFSVQHLSGEEQKTLARKLLDPSLTFESDVAADMVPKIVEALLK